jgi:hypothetical protein
MLLDEVTLYRIEPLILCRRERLREGIDRLKGGQTLTSAAMRDRLTVKEFRSYKVERDAVFPPPTRQQREVLKCYDFHLGRGDRRSERARKLPFVGPRARRREMLLAEACRHYCSAHEMLGELLSQSALAYLFDRKWVDGEGQVEEPEGMPRRTNSTSEYAVARWRQVGALAMSDLQRSVLRHSLNALESNGG